MAGEPPALPALADSSANCSKEGKSKKEKGKSKERFSTFAFFLLPFALRYAVAGLLPVIGGRIGFSGLTAGSLSCGC